MQVKYSKISRFKIKKVVKSFSCDFTALQSAEITGLNRNTINRFYALFRKAIYEYQTKQFEELKMNGQVEMDESYFGAKRIR